MLGRRHRRRRVRYAPPGPFVGWEKAGPKKAGRGAVVEAVEPWRPSGGPRPPPASSSRSRICRSRTPTLPNWVRPTVGRVLFWCKAPVLAHVAPPSTDLSVQIEHARFVALPHHARPWPQRTSDDHFLMLVTFLLAARCCPIRANERAIPYADVDSFDRQLWNFAKDLLVGLHLVYDTLADLRPRT